MARMRVSTRLETTGASGWAPSFAATAVVPRRAARVVRAGVVELVAVEAVGVEVDDDRVAVLQQRDRTAEERLRRHVPDHQTDRPAREPAVGHERDR